MNHRFIVDTYEVQITVSDSNTQHIVFELAFQNHSDQVLQAYHELEGKPFHYVTITGFDWENDLSPWPESALLRNDDVFAGKAADFLRILVEKIVPQALREIGIAEGKCHLVGYSLAGLGTFYMAYHSDVFSSIASVSGALWYPKFVDYVRGHSLPATVERVYLSLGDKEQKTRNPYMSRVQEATELIYNHLTQSGVKAIFELNPGNHFKNEILRIAKGIHWILNE